MLASQSAKSLESKRCYVPALGPGAAEAVCACFHRAGVDAEVVPASTSRTRGLGLRHVDDDACYPAVLLTGDFVNITTRAGFQPERSMFFLPSADGPCRLGQYAPALKRILQERGCGAVQLLTPSDKNGFAELDKLPNRFRRTLWRAVVAADLIHSALLRTRPYEAVPGAAAQAFDTSLAEICGAIRSSQSLKRAVRHAAERFGRVPVNPARRLRIGIVGEIFCRLNSYANNGLVSELERHGAEVRPSGAAELIEYCSEMELQALRVAGRRWTSAMAIARARVAAQRADRRALERAMGGPVEPEIAELLALAEPYLPGAAVVGESVLSLGKAAWLARNGADGVIDTSPFGCMNGIVSEAIYPRLSRNHGGIPIRNLYFDGTHTDLEAEVGAFVEVAREYRRRKA
jgi:predicted nucleotide-binding protein (sugar kinase/HSP70/actin superfamily)